MNIYGKVIVLRAPELSDMEILRDMMNSPFIEEMVVGWAWPISSYAQEQWFKNQEISSSNQRFIVEYKKVAVGVVGLTGIDWKNRKATTSIKLHSTCPKGIGIGTDAVMSLERYAFEELNLNRLEGSWLPYNTASEKLHKKCGWREEGLQRKAIYKNGKFNDLVIVGCLKEDYENIIQKTNYWG